MQIKNQINIKLREFFHLALQKKHKHIHIDIQKKKDTGLKYWRPREQRKAFFLKLHKVNYEVSENKYISNTVVMVCTIKAQIQPWKALKDTIRGQKCLSKTKLHSWGRLEVRWGKQSNVPQQETLRGRK